MARCLNRMGYGGLDRNWNMVSLALWMFVSGQYVSTSRALAMWLPFLILVTTILVMAFLL